MALTLSELRTNLDGLGYYLGSRGLLGLGNLNGACDLDVLGNIDCDLTPLRDLQNLDAYTRSAIFQFQLDNALAATGQNGPDLQAKVEGTVKILQNNLKIVLQTQLPITGKYFNQTLNAVKTYQRNRSLLVTGIATRSIRKQVDDDARQIIGKPPSPSPSPTPTPTPSGSDLRSTLITLKQLRQQGTLSDSQFIDAVLKFL
jgi:peptidoglycan hydrolase-like protein with peptidoglycan-binding domain